jgi:hypothetical protein
MRRFWIALATLIATFSSAPAGSVQQGAFDQVAHSAPPPALAVARWAQEAALAEPPTRRAESEPDPDPVLLPLPGGAGEPHGRRAHQHSCVPPRRDDRGLPRLLERLPYHATAPPRRA